TYLILHVMSQVRKRISLLKPALGRNCFITTRERNRLERKEGNLLWIVERETNDRTDLIVVDAVNQGGNKHDFNTGFVQVVDRSQLHIEKVTDLTVTIRN